MRLFKHFSTLCITEMENFKNWQCTKCTTNLLEINIKIT